jgi:hypothetical protein
MKHLTHKIINPFKTLKIRYLDTFVLYVCSVWFSSTGILRCDVTTPNNTSRHSKLRQLSVLKSGDTRGVEEGRR